MTREQRRELAKVWALLTEYYGRQISDDVIRMYVEDVSDLDPAEIYRALRDYRMDRRNRHPPIPADIRDRIKPPPASPRSLAIEAAARILSALPKYGWNNPGEAEKFIGQLGWKVVELQGGWLRLCESTQPAGVLQAQWTKLAEALQERAAAGETEPPALPKIADKQKLAPGLTSVAQLLKGKPVGQDE